MQHVLEQMQRGVGHGVRRAEHRQIGAAHRPPHAPCPKRIDTLRRQTLQPWIPELEVQLDGERHFGIEEIAAPLPGGRAHHGGEMIGRERLQARDGQVARRHQGVARGFHGLPRAVEVDVGLRPVFGTYAEERALCDALERDKLHRQARQPPVRCVEHTQTEQVVGGVARGCRGQDVADQQRQARVMAEIQRLLPLAIIEARQRFRARFGKVQRGQGGGRPRGQPRTVQPWVRQSRIVPHAEPRIAPALRRTPRVDSAISW